MLPTFKDSLAATGTLPKWLTYSLAALLAFYRTTEKGDGCLIGHRGDDTYEIHDDADKLAVVAEAAGLATADYVTTILKRSDFWGEDLTAVPGLLDAVVQTLQDIDAVGIKQYIHNLGEK